MMHHYPPFCSESQGISDVEKHKGTMSDFETSPPKEIEIDADGDEGEALLKKSPSPEPATEKTNGKADSDRRERSRSHSSHGRHRHRRSSHRRYSRSRSKSPYYSSKRRRSRYSRSRSYSYDRGESPYYSDRRKSYYRSRSRSPMSTRKRHLGDREHPEANRCLGVFGLSLYTQERGLREVFGRYGHIDEVQVVYDRQTGRSRGFAFVYFKSPEDAVEAKDRCNGIEIDGRRIRVDFSITERAHTPTPGIYLGKPTSRRSPGRRYSSSYRRSPSPYYYSRRSRSRSYSPPR
ncbi:transformer-2 protein homolog alpha-like isoform X2 [Pomacea canaliculata]|nr:transformer-2 protein homolog alpha-like isoform X2 [Pomacea canaliculata]